MRHETMEEAPDANALDREAYYAQARGWAQDGDAARARSLRLAWLIAGVAAGVAALEALALIALLPLKTIVPYTLLVDRNTGFVQALEGTQLPSLKAEASLSQSLLAQYVIAREGYDFGTISEQYHKVALWSAQGARAEYLARMPAGNPQSPLARFGRNASVTVQVESVSPLASEGGQNGTAPGLQTALVRFATEQHGPQQASGTKAYWVAVLRYRYSGQPMALADRLINPLGFQVVSYRVDQEAPPPDIPPPDAPPPDAPPPAQTPSAQTPSVSLPVAQSGPVAAGEAVRAPPARPPAHRATVPAGPGWGRAALPLRFRHQPPRQMSPREEAL